VEGYYNIFRKRNILNQIRFVKSEDVLPEPPQAVQDYLYKISKGNQHILRLGIVAVKGYSQELGTIELWQMISIFFFERKQLFHGFVKFGKCKWFFKYLISLGFYNEPVRIGLPSSYGNDWCAWESFPNF